MKVSSLSLAIFMALGVVACGGSGGGNNDQTVPDSNSPAPSPAPAPAPEQPSTHDSTLVDPTQTHVVDDRDLLKETTVGSLQYIRHEGSDYDRIYNPEKRASSTPLLGVPLDVQNPKLTNIVLARQELQRADGVPVKAQFAGGLSPEPLTREGRPQEQPSLQVENFQNVDILAGAFKQFGSAQFHTDGSQIPNNTNLTNDKATNSLGDDYDYNTHVSDNWDKNASEFTRERVSHVYTLRKEYLQPYVDYPHIQNPTDANHRINSSGDYPNRQYGDAFYVRPLPGHNPSAHDLLNAAGHITTYFPNNYFSWDNARQASHDPNNGLGVHAVRNGPTAAGTIPNSRVLFGSLENAAWPDEAPANAWKNRVGHTDRLAVGRNWVPGTATTPGHYSRGDNRPYTNTAIRHDYTDQATLDWTKPSIMGRYPDGGYPRWTTSLPRFPNETYDNRAIHRGTGGAGTVDNEGKEFYTNPLYNHEHTYLEEEEFTAIREGKPVRPLRNPKANTWQYQQLLTDWATTYSYNGTYTVQTGTDPVTGRPITIDLPVSGTVSFNDLNIQNHNLSLILGRINSYQPPECSGANVTACNVTVELINATASNHRWDTASAQNLKDGVQGEFRGPNYDGYNEGERTIRYSDERIWKAGAPGYKPEHERKFGGNLIWWSTQDSAFENWATNYGWDPRARRVDNNIKNDPQDLERTLADARDEALEIQPTGDITNGLIRIGGNRKTLGEEMRYNNPAHIENHPKASENPFDSTKAANQWYDHHNTTTRIFGRYHLAYADQSDGNINQVTMNSYQGARSFVARVDAVEPGQPVQWGNGSQSHRYSHRAKLEGSSTEAYSIGAIPMTLQKVQYGRVSNNLDLDTGEGPFDGGFLHSPFRSTNATSTARNGVDNSAVHTYFYRGVEATTIDQMKAVTANNGMARYEGHALMYGIDNSYKGITSISEPKGKINLPNAFAIDDNAGDMSGYLDSDTGSLGLGNFVQVDVNFGTNKVVGDVYNAWIMRQWVATNRADGGADGKVVKDLKVHFTGDIMGNTVIGTADRTYITGDDKADFRASFFGEQADEMGGAFNSVTREEKYGSAYEDGDWGGVFGAKKVGSGNTFQGDDGSNVYTGL